MESNVVIKPIKNKKAVFIPFDYCDNADDNICIGVIVFYDHKKYLYHINLQDEDFAFLKSC